MILLLATGLCGAGVSYAVTLWVLHRAADRLIDVPNERSSHGVPTPLGGGIALVTVTAVAGSAYGLVTSDWHMVGFLLTGGLLVAGISLWDDIRHVPNRYRFAVHTLAGLVALTYLGSWSRVALPGGAILSLGSAGPPITFLWIVGLINAYNFMDGIDGIAGGQAVVTGVAWAWLGTLIGATSVAVIGAAIAGGAVGFLLLNWAPARIFLGDVGSAFLGFCFAVLPLAAVGSDPRGPLVAALFVGPFVFDSAFTVVRRALNGENVFLPHRRHLYQRLVDSGLTHATVSGLYLILATLLAALGSMVWFLPDPGFSAALFTALALCLAVWALVRHVERRNHAAPQPIRSS